MHTTSRIIHIVAGSLGILSGFFALYVAKGGSLHRQSGRVFVYAMITMALFGAFIAGVWRIGTFGNVPIGIFTAYLVLTSLISVRPPDASRVRGVDLTLMVVVLAVALSLITAGFVAATSPTGRLSSFPPAPLFIFGALALIACTGDVKLLRAGGTLALRGATRLGRHLWRMSLALVIAAFSFFIGQARVIPKPMRIYPLLMVPPLIALATLLYWLWRVRFRQKMRGLQLKPVSAAPVLPRTVGGVGVRVQGNQTIAG
jgi:uncharacterized membrane protein